MNAYQAVKVVDNSGTYIAIAKVLRLYGNPTYEFAVEVELPGGQKTSYALCTSFGTTQFGNALQGGDHVLVRFTLEDQFARVITMEETASRFRETVVR